MSLAATVVIPTFDHGESLRLAAASVLAQSVQDFELIMVGDGVPDAVKPIVQEVARSDARIRFVDHPKHAVRGEPYLHEALLEARGRIVCYLCDRDFWLPTHLETMIELLRDADFAHCLPLHVFPDGTLRGYPIDLANPGYHYLLLNESAQENRIPLSCWGHSLAFYRSLTEGWSPTPAGRWIDLHMIRKFLRRADCRAQSGRRATAVTFPVSVYRVQWTSEQRVAEMARWRERLQTPEAQLRFQLQAAEVTMTEIYGEMSRLSQYAEQLHYQVVGARSPLRRV